MTLHRILFACTVLAIFAHPAAAREIVINAVGDIMLAGSATSTLKRLGYDYHFAATAVELALIGAGIPPEERSFSPHITLARLKETPADKVLALEERQREFATPAFPAGEFHLYSSILTRDGAIHKREATYPLSG